MRVRISGLQLTKSLGAVRRQITVIIALSSLENRRSCGVAGGA